MACSSSGPRRPDAQAEESMGLKMDSTMRVWEDIRDYRELALEDHDVGLVVGVGRAGQERTDEAAGHEAPVSGEGGPI